MPFKRVWDASCPKEYDRWEEDGATWVIKDLPPEDDKEAVRVLVENLIPDETLCIASGLEDDEISLKSMANFWRHCLGKRMSLGCYTLKEGTKTLVALNCCIVICADDEEDKFKIEGECWQNVYNALHYAETRVNVFELLNMDKVLYAMGLVVKHEYRGARLGARILAARKPLSLAHGIRGTSTVFTGIASQKSAERAGFRTAAEVSLTELANSGLRYPADDNKIIKLMLEGKAWSDMCDIMSYINEKFDCIELLGFDKVLKAHGRDEGVQGHEAGSQATGSQTYRYSHILETRDLDIHRCLSEESPTRTCINTTSMQRMWTSIRELVEQVLSSRHNYEKHERNSVRLSLSRRPDLFQSVAKYLPWQRMTPFKRVWDASCPKEYDRWEEDGATWVIQDLPPEDDEEGVKILVENLIPDEPLCIASGLKDDEISSTSMANYWRHCFGKRMSLACYKLKDGTKTLVALNCCIVICADDKEDKFKIEGESWQNVYNALHYVETRVNVFELLKTDIVLYAMGLVVKREYRGARLAARILVARTPLCQDHGIRGTSTVFSGIVAQKSAERAGFRTAAAVSLTELASSGLRYPRDDNRIIKLMVKTFDC